MQTNQQINEIRNYAARVIRHKAKQLVGTAGFTESDRDDLEQEMMIDVITRLPKYNASRGALKTFVACIIERKISKLIRYRTSGIRDFRRVAFSINAPIESGDGDTFEQGDFVAEDIDEPTSSSNVHGDVEEMELAEATEQVVSELPANLRRLCDLLKTKTLADAAREMGIPRTTLQDRVSKLRGLFEDAGLRKFL